MFEHSGQRVFDLWLLEHDLNLGDLKGLGGVKTWLRHNGTAYVVWRLDHTNRWGGGSGVLLGWWLEKVHSRLEIRLVIQDDQCVFVAV